MQPEVLAHEPETALFPGEDVLVFYRALAVLGQEHLRGGILAAEVHTDHADEVTDLWREAGFVDVRVHKDLFGRDRVVTAVKA
jgi:release factor glutamine methyltransferase